MLKKYLSQIITKDQAKDTGMAFVLICLIISYFWKYDIALLIAIVILFIDIIWPGFFRPFAKVWFGLSHILGTIMSKIILSIIFFLLVTPVGLIRRLMGADSLQMKQWKRNHSSVFKVREHRFLPEDIRNPY